MSDKIIFHIDVNSAYLSWTAAHMLQKGCNVDIRDIPSIIGGNNDNTHGIVLAKSIPAKKFNIKTGEPVLEALKKCPKLQIFKPDYSLYMKSSNAMYELLTNYSPLIERFSIDEVFIDASHFKNCYMQKAIEIKNKIHDELGFNVNIGISTNKLLAKMASDLEPKNTIHTIFPDEIEEKLWSLPVDSLFMVGKATSNKLDKLNIKYIGDLAKYNKDLLISKFKSFGIKIYNYANGIDDSPIRSITRINIKGLGNSTTLTWEVTERDEAHKVLLSLVETVCMRLRANNSLCKVVAVSVKSASFVYYSHQRTMSNYSDSTEEIYKEICIAFDESWTGEPIRQLGVRVTKLTSNDFLQSTLFDNRNIDKMRALDETIDNIRRKYGNSIIIRSSFLNSGIKPMNGGNGEEDYLMMSSNL